MNAITVCVSASSTDGALAPLVDLQALLGATSSEEVYSPFEVQQQQGALRRASAWAERFIGQPILASVYSERVSGYGQPTLLLSRTPIRAILRVFDSTTTSSATEFTSTQIVVEDDEAGLIKRVDGETFGWSPRLSPTMGFGLEPGSESKDWLVEYQAGYVFPQTSSTGYGTSSTDQTLPEDISHGVLLRAREIVNGDTNVLSKKVGDLAITYRGRGVDATGTSIRSEAEECLVPFRRVV